MTNDTRYYRCWNNRSGMEQFCSKQLLSALSKKKVHYIEVMEDTEYILVNVDGNFSYQPVNRPIQKTQVASPVNHVDTSLLAATKTKSIKKEVADVDDNK